MDGIGNGVDDRDSDDECYVDDSDVIVCSSHQSLHCSFGCLSDRDMTRTFEQEEAGEEPG